MMFGVLTVLFLILVLKQPERSTIWLRLGAIATGLATGTKYTAGLLVIPLMLAANAGWLIHAASTIHHRADEPFAREFGGYVANHPQLVFFITESVEHQMTQEGMPPSLNTVPEFSERVDHVAFYGRADALGCVPANVSELVPMRWFGPFETNFRYSPTWQGEDRIVVMPLKDAERLGVLNCIAPSHQREAHSS